MNIAVTSKEEILEKSIDLVFREGWEAVNIRTVATSCGVSVGSIYNYFDSKSDLIIATVESVWLRIFQSPEPEAISDDTIACISWMYDRLEQGYKRYPNFFTLHSLGFIQEDKAKGKERMYSMWQHIVNMLCNAMRSDKRIRPDAFNEQFTINDFANTLFSLMLSALLRNDYDPSTVIEIVTRTLY